MSLLPTLGHCTKIKKINPYLAQPTEFQVHGSRDLQLISYLNGRTCRHVTAEASGWFQHHMSHECHAWGTPELPTAEVGEVSSSYIFILAVGKFVKDLENPFNLCPTYQFIHQLSPNLNKSMFSLLNSSFTV